MLLQRIFPTQGLNRHLLHWVGRFFITKPPGKSYVLILDSKLNLFFALSQSFKAVTNILKKTLWKSSVQKTCRKTRPMENCLPTTSILHFYTGLAFGKFFHEYATPMDMSVHLINRKPHGLSAVCSLCLMEKSALPDFRGLDWKN